MTITITGIVIRLCLRKRSSDREWAYSPLARPPKQAYPAFLKRHQCRICAEAKIRSILIPQVQADKASGE